MSVTTMSWFRLFDLPLDLLELLTLYFEGSEAVKVLTVSSNFHDIFARSVWRIIGRRVIDVAEPIRSSAYARYGHLVRSIDLLDNLDLEFDSHNWVQLFPNTTSMAFDVLYEMDDVKQAFMDAIVSLHGLRSLKVDMWTNRPPFDLETLARVLVARHRDPGKQSLREVIMFFGRDEDDEDDDEYDEEQDNPWTDLSAFVQTLSPLYPPIKLHIKVNRNYSNVVIPTPAQMNILRPHLASLPIFYVVRTEGGCMALQNRELFSPSGTRDDPVVFGQLREVAFRVCCASSLLYDYSDFTQVKFPVIKSIAVAGDICIHQLEEGATSAIQTLLLQEWPELKELSVYVSRLTPSTVDKLVEFNPQLTSLGILIHRDINDTDGVFMLERVTGRLPHLTRFTLYGDLSISVDSDWLQGTSLVDIRSSRLEHITVYTAMLSPRFLGVMLALPNLNSMGFWNCVLPEPELVMDIFKKHRQSAKENTTVGIGSLTINASRANSNWSAELVLELIASLPHLKSCGIYGDSAIKNAIQEKHPNIRLWP
ncbi:hypothetical protein GQ42DRAFT_31159 [Ramicandelaber brevisporus]|nr:hypothetical protein GQ42DRAFT_31159 [Ramicandelaber brevisporus]